MAEGARQRKSGVDAEAKRSTPAAAKPVDESPRQASEAVTLLDILRIIVGLILINFLLSYFITGDSFTWGQNPWWSRPKVIWQMLQPTVNLTDVELLAYNGADPTTPIYVGLNGTIYDVSAGRRIYGPGGSYSGFAGRDAARAFVTGCFKDDAVPDLRGVEWAFVPRDVPHFDDTPDAALSDELREYRRDMLAKAHSQVAETIEGWAKVFRGETGKDYFQVGRVHRDPAWADNDPILPLCKQAEGSRPKTRLLKKDAGAVYRGKT